MAAGNNDWVDRNKMEEATRYLMNMLRPQPNPAQPNQAQLNQAQPEAAEVKRHLMVLVIGLTQVIPPHDGLDFNELIQIVESIEGEHLAEALLQIRQTSFLEGNANQVVQQIQNFLNGAEFQNALNANGARGQSMPVQQINRAKEIFYSLLTNLSNVMFRFSLDPGQQEQLYHNAVMDADFYRSAYEEYSGTLLGMLVLFFVFILLIVLLGVLSIHYSSELVPFEQARLEHIGFGLQYTRATHEKRRYLRNTFSYVSIYACWALVIICPLINCFIYSFRYGFNGNRSVADRLTENFVYKSQYPLLYDRSGSPKVNPELIEKLSTLLTSIRQYIEERPRHRERVLSSHRMKEDINPIYLEADFIKSLESVSSVLKSLLLLGHNVKRGKNS